MKKEQASDYLKTQIKNHRNWIKRNSEAIREMYQESLDKELSQNDFDAAKVISMNLEALALYYGAKGVIGILDGEENDWALVDLAIAYRTWSARYEPGVLFKVVHQGLVKTPRPLKDDFPNIANLICYAYVNDLKEMQEEFWKLYLKILNNPIIIGGEDKHWDGIHGEGFLQLLVLKLFMKTKLGEKVEPPKYLEKHSMGPYQALFDAWEKPDQLKEPLHNICDYHCQKMYHDPGEVLSPFHDTPFDLIPYEILAIYKLREELGLETPEIEHPLLELPTASRKPRKVTISDDPIFERIEKLYMEQVLA